MRTKSTNRILAWTIFLTVANVAVAQGTWIQAAPAPGIEHGALAYDAARDQHVLLSANATWTWDGFWIARDLTVTPSPRADHAMAYDAGRGVVVMFGGVSEAGVLDDTWEWDGTTWTLRATATAPAARRNHAMVYDPARDAVVLFGGIGFTDTWTWDGSTWTPAQTSQPSPPFAGPIAFDAARREVVMSVGGTTWTWNGNDWTQRLPTTSPPSLITLGMAYDTVRSRTVLVGETPDGSGLVQTWEWDGTDWSRILSPTRPTGRPARVSYDEARGYLTLFRSQETWRWDGVDWQRYAPRQFPSDRGLTCYDSARAEVLMVSTGLTPGISPDTWVWNGSHWAERLPDHRPPPLDFFGIAFDRARGRAVLFGDPAGTTGTPELWEWDGIDWTQGIIAAGPSPTSQIVYDSARDVLVLVDNFEVWEWDGTAWSQFPYSTGPAVRALTYDSTRERVVAVDADSSTRIWEWDGSTWTLAHEGPAPQQTWPWGGLHVVHDPDRRLNWIVHVNGSEVRLGMGTGPGLHWRTGDFFDPPGLSAMVDFDEARGELVLYGGCSAPMNCPTTTWLYRPGEPTLVDVFGTACQGSTTPSLTTVPDARLGQTFSIDLAQLPSFAAVGLLGDSATSSNSLALPLPLDGIGMPGCVLSVNPTIAVLLPVAGASATWTVPIPVNHALLGEWFYGQGYVLDPSGNPFGATTTEAFAARIGAWTTSSTP